MICLTGDIHHQSLRTGNQQHCDETEVKLAVRFLDLLREYDVKATFFVSGRAFDEQWEELRPLAQTPLVELGGHTHTCFEPALWHRFWNKAIGSYNGPAWYERLDVARTLAAAERRTGRRLRVWRNHMYKHGPHTDRVLAEAGLLACSDRVVRGPVSIITRERALVDIPINIIPDHEHLFHAERTPQWVARWRARYRWTDAFGPESYDIDTWTELVLAQLRENEAQGALSTLIIHPITMWLCDRFRGVTRILEHLAQRRTVHLGEVARAHLGAPARVTPVGGLLHA